MTTLNKLLDKAREMCSSDLAIADRLGITRSAVSKWRAGGKITAEHVAKLIEIAGADPAIGLAILAEQDAKGAGSRVWGNAAKRLMAVASVALCAIAVPYLLNFNAVALASLPLM